MIGTLGSVVLDCHNPTALAAFYAELVGGTISVEEDGSWVDLEREGGQRLSFQLAPGLKPPAWPDPERPQQFHLDIGVERAQLEAAEKRVLDLGATLLEGDDDGSRNWRVYADPEGHPFCLCAH
ncbi:VOC family protein [Actinacidiphila acidipaludis]|uniref:VOC family protein n=1 Tax=Actinacidiphila acidipaludis TaxID=2873382 RepID=A0ABS7Q191_9ACTN|nr:VOC family protein [Streptomyces acidipaludis]MBY8876905.1 VOC family protein [Streptomyces acidipaludis]